MEDVISRAVFDEYKQRIEDENSRQNHRIEELEHTVTQIHELTVSIEKLTTSVESMVKVQEQQGKRLETIENRDGETWRTVVSYVLTAVIGAAVAAVINLIRGGGTG